MNKFAKKEFMTDLRLLKDYPVIYNGKFAEIYDMQSELKGVAFAFWRGFFRLSDETFIREMIDSVELVEKYKIKIYISDHSDLQIVTNDVLDWLHANWYAVAAKNGLLIEAALDAKSIFAQLSLQKMLDEQKTSGVKTVKYPDFLTAKEAIKQYLTENNII